MFDKKEFGERLREVRKMNNLTQFELSEELESISTSQSISAYENGVQSPLVATLAEFCDFFDVSADWLLFGGERNKSLSKTETKEKISSLINLIDDLGLSIEPVTDRNGKENGMYVLDLSAARLAGFHQLIASVYKFRKLFEEGGIDEELYNLLVKSSLDKLAAKTNDFAPTSVSFREMTDSRAEIEAAMNADKFPF